MYRQRSGLRLKIGQKIRGEEAKLTLVTKGSLRGAMVWHSHKFTTKASYRRLREVKGLAQEFVHFLFPKHFAKFMPDKNIFATRFIRLQRNYRFAVKEFYDNIHEIRWSRGGSSIFGMDREPVIPYDKMPHYSAHVEALNSTKVKELVKKLQDFGILVEDNPLNVGLRADAEKSPVFFEMSLDIKRLQQNIAKVPPDKRLKAKAMLDSLIAKFRENANEDFKNHDIIFLTSDFWCEK